MKSSDEERSVRGDKGIRGEKEERVCERLLCFPQLVERSAAPDPTVHPTAALHLPSATQPHCHISTGQSKTAERLIIDQI
ncbi:uncharacterized [Tachysurus ichikawai]